MMYGPVLSEDLLIGILSWVPVKALMRFKCVSKSWNSLIFDPTFVKLHLQRSSKTTQIMLAFREKDEDSDNGSSNYSNDLCLAPFSVRSLLENTSSTLDNAFWHRFDGEFIVGVCNGLVCLRDVCRNQHWFRVWNPATRFISRYSPGLLCVWYELDYMFGFGYDDMSDTYKVVALLLDVESHVWNVKVHCFGHTCWTNFSTSPIMVPITEKLNIGQFVSGTVNWLALRGLSSDYQLYVDFPVSWLVIFSYDLTNQTYRYLLPPVDLGLDVLSPDDMLGVLRGCLCLFYDHKGTNLVVWLMKEFGVEKSWTQLLNVSYDHLTFKPISLQKPLYVSESGDVMMLDNTLGIDAVVLYNQRDNKINHIRVPYATFFDSYDYCQSLASPYGK